MVNGIGPAIASLGVQQAGTAGAAAAAGKAAGAGQSFADVFQYAVADVDHLQQNANQQISQLVQGKGDVDPGQVSVAVEKADVAFQLMMQVRNKIVSAYQDIEKMQF